MRAIITGGGGFLGRRVAGVLRARRDTVVALDLAGDGIVVGDVTDPDTLSTVVSGDLDVVFHLASMVSSACEADPSAAFAVNVEGLRRLLDACAHLARPPRFVFASSVAVFGDGAVDDDTKHRPASTYGMTKAMGELLVNEATRRGIIDGRSARLPTVVIRPGAPNAAASSFASGMFREPLAGVDAVVPVHLDVRMVLIGARAAVEGLVALGDADASAFEPDRGVNLPALEVSVGDMFDVITRSGRATGRVTVAPDPAIEAIVGSWPAHWRAERARALGLPADRSLADVLDEYVAGM